MVPDRSAEIAVKLGGAGPRLRRLVLKATHALLSRGRTSWGTACVYGAPDFEENSLVAAVALAETGAVRVTLLARSPERAQRYLALVNRNAAPVDVVAKKSIRGLVRASTAGALLFTHGLYGSPNLTRRKVVVNLWHGFGPKATYNSTFTTRIRFDLMPCNTPVWAGTAARVLGAPEARLVRSGNPRQVNLRRHLSPAALRRLGVASSPYILWMPTYRRPKGTWGIAWHDAPALSGDGNDPASVDVVSAMARVAEDAGVGLIVKPHPGDADRYEREGLRVITTDEIFDAGATLYQFIGSSAAMISDYSSVWVEYLELDRPLALFCPDLPEYRQGRGLNEPYMTDIARDLIVERPQDIKPFFDAVGSGSDWRPRARESVRTALGLDGLTVTTEPFTTAVIEELRRRQRSAPKPSAS